MTAEAIAKALGGHKVGDGWSARCPAHDDRRPSLSIRDVSLRKVLVYCHAGCTQEQVIDALRARGLWTRPNSHEAACPRSASVGSRLSSEDVGRRDQALALWHASTSAAGTAVERYLASRKLRLPPSETLRFNGNLKHPSGGSWPTMVALVTRGRDGVPLAVHRTYIAYDGGGKASLEPAKMMLGPCRGGVVRLADAHSNRPLMIGEGIETCLAAMQAKGYPAWAALSTSGLRALDLPVELRDLIVLADGDEAGESAARECASRWVREGRRVQIARPPQGFDFNDMLLGRAPRIKEYAR